LASQSKQPQQKANPPSWIDHNYFKIRITLSAAFVLVMGSLTVLAIIAFAEVLVTNALVPKDFAAWVIAAVATALLAMGYILVGRLFVTVFLDTRRDALLSWNMRKAQTAIAKLSEGKPYASELVNRLNQLNGGMLSYANRYSGLYRQEAFLRSELLRKIDLAFVFISHLLAERSWSEFSLRPFPVAIPSPPNQPFTPAANVLKYAEIGGWISALDSLLFARPKVGFFGSSATVLDYFFGESADHFGGYLDKTRRKEIESKVNAHHDRRIRAMEERRKYWSDFAKQALLTLLGIAAGILISQLLLK